MPCNTDNNAPTETDIALVRQTFDHVVPISGVAADMFYERLFYMAPSLRRMFPEDMRDQKRKLIMMLATAVHGLTDLDALVPQLMALGARHAGYGVKDYHYKTVGEALIWTLERGLADAVHARGASAPGCASICWSPRPCRPAPTKSPPCRRRSNDDCRPGRPSGSARSASPMTGSENHEPVARVVMSEYGGYGSRLSLRSAGMTS